MREATKKLFEIEKAAKAEQERDWRELMAETSLEACLDMYGLEVPVWIDLDCFDEVSNLQDLAAWGCDTGLYMPAVTYYQATKTMADQGDAILEYLQDQGAEYEFHLVDQSFAQFCCDVVSAGVLCWAIVTLSAIEDLYSPEDFENPSDC